MKTFQCAILGNSLSSEVTNWIQSLLYEDQLTWQIAVSLEIPNQDYQTWLLSLKMDARHRSFQATNRECLQKADIVFLSVEEAASIPFGIDTISQSYQVIRTYVDLGKMVATQAPDAWIVPLTSMRALVMSALWKATHSQKIISIDLNFHERVLAWESALGLEAVQPLRYVALGIPDFSWIVEATNQDQSWYGEPIKNQFVSTWLARFRALPVCSQGVFDYVYPLYSMKLPKPIGNTRTNLSLASLFTGKQTLRTLALPNTGQWKGFPLGCPVETLGLVRLNQVQPVYAGTLPEGVTIQSMRLYDQMQLVVDAILGDSSQRLFEAMALDRSNLSYTLDEIRERSNILFETWMKYKST
ncbi:MAG: hypothetical protein AB7S88_04255 [Candidatus Izemoplasmatales bacterium]